VDTSGIYGLIIRDVYDFVQSDLFTYLAVLAVAFLTTGFTFYLLGKNRRRAVRMALRAELMTNSKVTRAIMAYADGQLSGESSIAPMPMYRTVAFREYANSGLLAALPRRIAEELEQAYLRMLSVNKAGQRQEELAFGPAAAFPNAHLLRLENLNYLRDTAHNIIEPYQDRLRDTKL
jgi:hypothetical protein